MESIGQPYDGSSRRQSPNCLMRSFRAITKVMVFSQNSR